MKKPPRAQPPARPELTKPATPARSVDMTASTAPTEPLLPNERDEKVGSTGGVPSPRVQQGARDLKRGVQDTSRATEANAAYEKQKK